MAKTKTPVKKSSSLTPSWTSSWTDIERSMDSLRKNMEQAFSSFPSMPKISHMSCDVIDEGKQYRVKMDVPGIKKNEIKLNVTENSVEVSAEHKESSEDKKKNYLRKERSHISYYRSLPLSEKVQPNKVIAKLTDGVLDITLPKSTPSETQMKKSISIS